MCERKTKLWMPINKNLHKHVLQVRSDVPGNDDPTLLTNPKMWHRKEIQASRIQRKETKRRSPGTIKRRESPVKCSHAKHIDIPDLEWRNQVDVATRGNKEKMDDTQCAK